MDAVSREISSLSLCLETLHDDCSGNAIEYPPQLKQSLVALLKNCDTVTRDMDRTLSSTLKSKLGASVSWSTSGSSEMDKLRVRLEAYKVSIEIALEMVSMYVVILLPSYTGGCVSSQGSFYYRLSHYNPFRFLILFALSICFNIIHLTTHRFLIRDVKEDTAELKGLSAAIKTDTEQIPGIKQDTSQITSLVQEIASLRLQVSNLEQRGDNVVLQRFLAESTTYAESAYDVAEQLYGTSGSPSLGPIIPEIFQIDAPEQELRPSSGDVDAGECRKGDLDEQTQEKVYNPTHLTAPASVGYVC
jgi:regulator of replication initiation timing